jgi:alpha-beta hydrolase superfamily lysophospholipase
VITYAYDQRGFGGAPHRGYWAGSDAYVEDLRMAAQLVRDRHPGVPLYILGESMGGAIVMVAMAGDAPPQADGVILVAPAVWSRDYMPFYQTIPLWFSAHLFPWMRLTGEGLSIRPSDNIEMLRKFSADPMVIKATRIDTVHGLVDLMDAAQAAAPNFTPRSLILYGTRDEVVPDNPTFAMIKRLPHHNPPLHTVAVYTQGYHMLLRDLQAERVIDDVLAWLRTPDRPLPSGADQTARQVLGGKPPGGKPEDKQHAPGLLPGVERP